MIKSRSFVHTDASGKEVPEEGLQLFDLTANDGDIHQYAASSIPSHWHKELEVFVLLKGRVQVGAGEAIYILQAGDGCFINTEVIHSFTAAVSSPCHFRSFVFHADMIGGTPGSIFDSRYVRPLLESGASFLKFRKETGDHPYFEQFERAFAACAGEYYGYEFEIRDALSHILLHARSKGQAAPPRAISSIQEARLKEMLIWIDQNPGKEFSVADIAGTANICPRECQRIFNQYLHDSPIAYVRRKRIFTAAKQLSDTDEPVTDIALNCGFSNPGYFSRQFRELMGSTPSEYRAAVKNIRTAVSR